MKRGEAYRGDPEGYAMNTSDRAGSAGPTSGNV